MAAGKTALCSAGGSGLVCESVPESGVGRWGRGQGLGLGL